MNIFQNVVWLLVLIGVMILIHELGHFWAARFFDVKVDVFSFGFGPRLFGFRRGETDYRFSAILFGGYVKMSGEQPGEDGGDDPRGFLAKPRSQRLIIAFAGPFMNIVLAAALLTGLYMVKFQKIVEPKERAVIAHLLPDSAAQKAGMLVGDRIVRIDGTENPTWEEISIKEIASAYKTIPVTVERAGKRIELSVTPVLDDRVGVGSAGWVQRSQIQVANVTAGMPADKAGLRRGDLLITVNGQPIQSPYRLQEIIKNSNGKAVSVEFAREHARQTVTVTPELSATQGQQRWMIGVEPQVKLEIITTKLSLPAAFAESVRQNAQSGMLIVQFLKGMLERRMSPKSLEGPIGIARLSGDAAREGPTAFILLMAMVSLNLAIFNLLPIPILDGGVILMLLVEMVMRRDINVVVKEAVFKVGFVFLMAVVMFVLYSDISKLLPPG